MIGKRIQNYKIISLLGEGGMGIVYKALDVKLERFAALKILNINSPRVNNLIQRFRREAKHQANLMHPNIVSVYGFVEEKNIMGIAMEYVEGQTIEQILNQEGKLEVYPALDIISQVLNGIAYAHNQGFIHRDLKPSNIIIDMNGNAKIMDFGISKSVDEIESITQFNVKPGTLLYMSPEQLSGNEVTKQSDLYALSITLYEMIAGYYPYESKTFYDVVDAHINKIPPRISDSYPDILKQVDEIILKGMGKSESGNFVDAVEFKNEVDDLMNAIQLSSSYTSSRIVLSDEVAPEPQKNSSFIKIGNFFLFLLFVGLAIVVYFVVEQYLEKQQELEKTNKFNFSQNYKSNPNYIEETNWESSIINPDIDLSSILMLDNLNGYIVGDKGLILQTNDAGINWVEVKTKYSNKLLEIISHNSKKFCVGENGLILVNDLTSKNWTSINTDTNESLFSINFVNDNIGFICGSNGTVLKTFDTGLTWNNLNKIVDQNLYCVSNSDEKNIFISGWNGTLLRSTDQGQNWKIIKTNYLNYFKNILFINQFLGFIVGGDGILLRTENGGDSWEKIDIASSAGLFKIFFDNNDEGLILSNQGDLFRTIDAGKTWSKMFIGKAVVLNDIQKLSTGKYIIVGNSGFVFRSKLKSD